MVTRYVILANSNDKTFDVPRQLIDINGEKLIERTIKLLKKNGIKDITIVASEPQFEKIGEKIYKPKNSDYDYKTGKGYWLNAFPYELMNKPVCFIWGDVYFSERAIKTIVEEQTKSTLFFCSYNNKSTQYIKQHDEPLAYKIVDTNLFKEHIEKVKKLYDEGKCNRNPIVWEVYRSINGIDVNEHKLTNNYIAINDISCDIDSQKDLEKLKLKINTNYNYKLSIIIAYYNTYQYVTKILDRLIPQLTEQVEVILVDDGCHETKLDKYKQIKIIHLDKNIGGAGAMNVGIINSTGKYIGFIDSDDYIAEDYVETLLNKINESNTDTIFMDWQDMETKEIHKRPTNYAQWKCIYKRTIIPMFVEGRKYSFDVPFYDELNAKNYTKDYVDKVLYYYNSGNPNNLTHEKEKVIKQEKEKNMIKVQVIIDFTLEKFDELKNIQRKSIEQKGKLFVGDTFECTKEMVDYLTGNNDKGKVVVKVIEVEPEKWAVTQEEDSKVHIRPVIDNKIIDTPVEKTIKPKKKKSSKK